MEIIKIVFLLLASLAFSLAQDSSNEPFKSNPVYRYSYQVSDDNEQTYVSKDESRNGKDVSGTYSYVDPNGALVTVQYTAGEDGYTEQRTLQENFVRIRARRPLAERRRPSLPVQTGSRPILFPRAPTRPQIQFNPAPAITEPAVSKETESGTDKANVNKDDLVAKIIALVTPVIRQAIADATKSQ